MIVNLGADRHMMKRLMFLGAATTVIAMTVPATQAQDAAVTKRVDRLEKEMRAVQRQVFPGGAPAFFEGEIAPDNVAGERARSAAPVIDLTARCLWCHEDVTPHHYDSGFILYQPPAEYSALITTLRQYFSFYPLPASA